MGHAHVPPPLFDACSLGSLGASVHHVCRNCCKWGVKEDMAGSWGQSLPPPLQDCVLGLSKLQRREKLHDASCSTADECAWARVQVQAGS